ncbi:MAG: O-antigen ligase family protein [Patescibacteria group bacterium]
MNKTLKAAEWLFYLLIFILPIQTRWLYRPATYKDEFWEYQTRSLYGTEILFLVILVLAIIYFFQKFNLKNFIQRYRRKKLAVFSMAAAVLIALAIINITSNDNPGFSFYKAIQFIESLALAGLIIFFLYNFKKFSWALIGSGLFQGILAIEQFLSQKVIASKWLGMAGQDPQVLGTSVIESGGQRILRAYGSLPHPNILAGFLVIVLLFIIYQFLEETNKKKKKFLLASFIFLFIALLVTFSRGAALALFASLLFILIIGSSKKDFWNKHKSQINKIVIATLLVIIGFSIVKSDLIFTRFQMQERLEVKSITERISGYQDTWRIFKQHLFIGTGPGNYTTALSKLHPDWQVWQLQPVHNGFVLAMTEMGIILTLLFSAIAFFIVKKMIKHLKGRWFNIEIIFSLSIIISLIIICFFDHFLWSLHFGNLLLAVSALTIKFVFDEKNNLLK